MYQFNPCAPVLYWIGGLLFLLGATISSEVIAQSTIFDYRIDTVQLYELDPTSGEKRPIDDLAPYLYDIGPDPQFLFEVHVTQLDGGSRLARRANLVTERYLLLEALPDSTYSGLDNVHPDLSTSPAWVYHGPVALAFSRKAGKNNSVSFTSTPHQFPFLDPQNPITFARPIGYKILGFAYRFALVPANINHQDSNPKDNAVQLSFLRP